MKFIVKTDELQGLEEKNEARIRRLEDDDVFAVQDVLFGAPGANASGITTHIFTADQRRQLTNDHCSSSTFLPFLSFLLPFNW